MQLKILRVMAALTQAEAAAELGVTQAVISYFETGKAKPNPTQVAKLAKAYCVSEAKIVKAVEATARKAKEAHDG